ncbi:MAG: DUF1592 domain-containing protein [Myxococcota bacterium]
MGVSSRLWVVSSLALGACNGSISEVTPLAPPAPTIGVIEDVPAVESCTEPDAAPSSWRQLNAVHYRHAVATILGHELDAELTLDEKQGTVFSERGVTLLNDVARQIAAGEAIDCADEGCAEETIGTWATRAFRRAPDADELATLVGIHDEARADGESNEAALGGVLEILLQAPQTLYAAVRGEPNDAGLVRLSDVELASKLALALWDGVPDPDLLAAAEGGELSTADGVRRVAEGMLEEPRAAVNLSHFIFEWLGLGGGAVREPLESAAKDAELFPDMTPSLRAAMRREVEMLAVKAVLEDQSIEALFNSRDAFVNEELAALYGVDAPAGGEGWIVLPESERAGILTRAAFLTNYAGHLYGSAIRRGVFVLEHALCEPLGEPPPNVDDTPINTAGDSHITNQRDAVVSRTQGTQCQACHASINPAGFLFGQYDAIGAYQAEESFDGAAPELIDPSGSVLGQSFRDAVELSAWMAESSEARSCMVRELFKWSAGRHAHEGDGCALASAHATLAETGNLRDALLELVSSESFRFYRPEPAR